MKLFNKIFRKTDKSIPPWLQNVGVKNYNLDKTESEILSAITELVKSPLITCKSLINENAHVRLHSFIYLLGIIDAWCQFLNTSNASFYKICLNLFFYDFREAGFKYYELAEIILKDYNKYLQLKFFSDTLKLGGQDVLDSVKAFKETNHITSYHKVIPLLYKWEKIKPENYSPELKEFLFTWDLLNP